DGKITQREFEVVKNELLEAPVDEWTESPMEVEALIVDGEDSEHDAVPIGIPVDATEPETDETAADPEWLVFARQIPQLYWASLGAALLTVFFGGSFAPIAWIAVVVSAVALVRVKDEGMRWMAWVGLGLGLLFSLFGLFASGAEEAEPTPPAAAASDSEPVAAAPAGSLGVEFADLKEGWNAVPDPPLIVTGITTSPEAGPLDSFLYRFDDAAVLAGAYNPADGYVYGLMAKVGIRHEALSSMFVHVCYLLYPGTQDCFDKFMEESGVYGKTPEELSEGQFSTSWTFKGNEWRVEVVDDIETIRVLGPVQTG
ncbi:MAG TPA: hypothetical protein VI141_06285, partial [Acidimicrobiia bacterium]